MQSFEITIITTRYFSVFVQPAYFARDYSM